jgi:hypothetical protein
LVQPFALGDKQRIRGDRSAWRPISVHIFGGRVEKEKGVEK